MKEIVYKPHNYQSVLADVDIGDTLENLTATPILARNRLAKTGIQPYQRVYTEHSAPETIEVPEIEETAPIIATPIQTVSPTPTQGGRNSELSPALQGVLDIFDKYGLGYNVTSGYRPGATTSNGRPSHHSTRNAVDITPNGMTYDDWKERIRNSPEIQEYFRTNKLGILDETTSEMLQRTGGTGAHWHIGPDRIAVDTFKEWYGKRGGKIRDIRKLAPGGPITYLKHMWTNDKNSKSNSNQSSVPLTTSPQSVRQQISGGYTVPGYTTMTQSQEEDNSGWESPMLAPTQEAENAYNNINTHYRSEGGKDLDKDDFIRGYDTLRRFGFSKDYTDGILANWYQESRLQPNETNRSSNAKYIPQFLGARVQEYEEFLNDNNLSDGIETAAKYLTQLYSDQRIYNEENQKHNESNQRIRDTFRNIMGSDSYDYYRSGRGNYNQSDLERFNEWLKAEGLDTYDFRNRPFERYSHPNTFSTNDIRNSVTNISSYPTGEEAAKHFYNWFERGGANQYHRRGEFFNILNK